MTCLLVLEQTSTSEAAEGAGLFGAASEDSRFQLGMAAAKSVLQNASKYNPLQGVSSMAQVSASAIASLLSCSLVSAHLFVCLFV